MGDIQQTNYSDENIANIANILTSMANEIDNAELNNMVVYPTNANSIKLMSRDDISELIGKAHVFINKTMSSASTARGLVTEMYSIQSEMVQRISSVMLTGATEYFNNLKDTAQITADVLRTSALVGSATIYDKVLKGIAIADSLSQSSGLRKSEDELIKEHETLIYILLQKASLRIMNDDDYLSSETSDANIKSIINKIIETEDMTLIKSHLIRAAQIFFFNKMGKSVVENMSSINSKMEDINKDTNRDLSYDNSEVVDQYNLNQLRKRVLNITSNDDELKSFLCNVVYDIHAGDSHNHSKYFGMPQDASVFIQDIIGPNGFLSIDAEYRLGSLEKNVDYYMNNIIGKKIKKDGTISDGSSIAPPNGSLYKRVVSLQTQINESFDDIYDYIKQQYKIGFSDFGNDNDNNEGANIRRLDSLQTAINLRKEVMNDTIQRLLTIMSEAISNTADITNSRKRKTRDQSDEYDEQQDSSRARNSGGSYGRRHKRTRKLKNNAKKARRTKKSTASHIGGATSAKKKRTKRRPRRSTKKRTKTTKKRNVCSGK